MSKTKTTKVTPIPSALTKTRKVSWWGSEYTVTPAVARGHCGDGKILLRVWMLNTRPNYYLVRVDSSFFDDDNENAVDEMVELLCDEFSEKETERGYLKEDLLAQGIEPTRENMDLAGNEDRLGWPVVSLDSGYCWERIANAAELLADEIDGELHGDEVHDEDEEPTDGE